MKKIVSLLLLIPVSFCVWAQTSGTEYNDLIVDEQTKIGEKIIAFSSAETNEDMELALKVMIEQIDASIATVKNIGNWKGDASLKNSAIGLFNFYRSIATVEYRELLNILKHDEISESDAARMDAIMADITKREEKFDADFAYNQEEFAKRNNFTLEPNQLQEKIDGDN